MSTVPSTSKQSLPDIYSGQPEQVLGLLKINEQSHVLVRWTHGDAYVPYDFLKKKFPMLLLDYFQARSEFRRKGPTTRKKT